MVNLPPGGKIPESWKVFLGGKAEGPKDTSRGPKGEEFKRVPTLAEHYSALAWPDRKIPPRVRLLGDFVTNTSRAFIVGRTGLGKTLVGLAMACGMATGAGFLHWRSDRPARVLYIDGEMPAELIKERVIDMLARSPLPLPRENLMIYAADTDEET